jgi:hypothetical protein
MRGVYTTAVKIASLAAAKTLAYITAPSDKVVELLSASVTNESNATNFQMQCAIANISSLGTPTATSNTPTPHEAGDQAAGSTVKVNVTASEPTYGTTITQEEAPSLVGWRWEPLSEAERIYVKGGASIGLRMVTTPTSFDADVRLTFREIG